MNMSWYESPYSFLKGTSWETFLKGTSWESFNTLLKKSRTSKTFYFCEKGTPGGTEDRDHSWLVWRLDIVLGIEPWSTFMQCKHLLLYHHSDPSPTSVFYCFILSPCETETLCSPTSLQVLDQSSVGVPLALGEPAEKALSRTLPG